VEHGAAGCRGGGELVARRSMFEFGRPIRITIRRHRGLHGENGRVDVALPDGERALEVAGDPAASAQAIATLTEAVLGFTADG
jgi:hypothetical protein